VTESKTSDEDIGSVNLFHILSWSGVEIEIY
jgi:hypothetical protein